MVSETFDLAVVGAGVLGCFHAYHAAKRGLRALLIERNPMPGDASARNFGMIAGTLVDRASELAPYAQATRELYLAIQAETEIGVRRSGSIYLAETPMENQVLREFAAAPGGLRCVYLSGDDARHSYGFIDPAYCRGALHFPDDLTIDPQTLLRGLLGHLTEQLGVAYMPSTTVISAEDDGDGCALHTADGRTLRAARAIICGGAEYRTLFPHHLREAGLQVCKLQMLRTAPQPAGWLPHAVLSGLSIRRYPAFHSCPSYPQLLAEPVAQELADFGIHLLLKQAPDGSVIVGDSHEYADVGAASGLEERTSGAINEAILAYGRRMVRLPSWSIAALWNGFYTVNPDGPIYRATVGRSIHIVTGIGGRGMTIGAGYCAHSLEQILAA
jgi:FAD dependent oxidoreductase TIGR03364